MSKTKVKVDILANKSGKGFRLVNNGDEAIVIPPGGGIFLDKPEDLVQGLAEKGFITEQEAAERIANYSEGGKQHFVKLRGTGLFDGRN